MMQGLLDRISDRAGNLGTSLKTIARVALKSRRPTVTRVAGAGDGTIVILGNGPSLATALRDDLALLQSSTCLAVNFFASTEAFAAVRPRYYVLADPHFFDKADTDPNVMNLIAALRQTSWPMTLFVPAGARKAARLFDGTALRVERFNFVRADGYHWLENLLWRHGLGMPRPRNVLIPSLMIALQMGYRTIKVLGADHGWLQTLSVTDDNRVVSVQPHFYGSDRREEQRVSAVYGQLRLDQVLESMTIAFRAYHSVRRFADRSGARIINATPGSMIDAFERGPLAN